MAIEPRDEVRFVDLDSRFGNKFICEDVPDHELPQAGMPAVETEPDVAAAPA